MFKLNTAVVDSTWLEIFQTALAEVDAVYLAKLQQKDNWLPGARQIFNAFSLPLAQTKYILLAESPYPRVNSAIGYAFWDGAVQELWSENGLSKPVNRATSLRNFIKMLLVARGDLLRDNCGQEVISKLNKSNYINSIDELFNGLLQHGFLLLNASLVLHADNAVKHDAKAWRPFMAKLLELLNAQRPDIELILFGKIAGEVNKFPAAQKFKQFTAEHPYNISFINNPDVLAFFAQFDLLSNGAPTGSMV